jgi:hypothetical protein
LTNISYTLLWYKNGQPLDVVKNQYLWILCAYLIMIFFKWLSEVKIIWLCNDDGRTS